jgi:periplasmic protein TonB
MNGRRFVLPAALLLASAFAVVSTAADEPERNPPCKPPQAVFTPDPHTPDSWGRKGPRTAFTQLELMVDTKGKAHDPVVIRSGGDDVDKAAVEAVRRWRFKPATCGKDAIETKISIRLVINLK